MSESRAHQVQTLDDERVRLGLPETLPFTDYQHLFRDIRPRDRVNIILERLQAEITTFERIKQNIDQLRTLKLRICNESTRFIINQINYLIKISKKHYFYSSMIPSWDAINKSYQVDDIFNTLHAYYEQNLESLKSIKQRLQRCCNDFQFIHYLENQAEDLLIYMNEYKAKANKIYEDLKPYITGGQYNKTRRYRKRNSRRKKSKRHKIY